MIYHFLIILDDIFYINTKNWIPIKRMIKSRRKASIGSRIYVFT